MHIEGYKILSSLGVGATSEVYSAQKNTTQETVALKRFSQLVTHDRDTRKRLQMEVETLATLKHPNIVELKGVFESDDNWGIELELVEGGDLSEWAKNYEFSLVEPKVWILVQIARGLGAAHEQGILHRDIKPENILVSTKGDVKLTDFGLARSLSRITVTKSGLLIGSLAYMAPEVINLRDASTSSDIFSFGIIAYELLTGQPPFQSETPQGLIRKISEGHFQPPHNVNPALPRRVSDVISRCLSQSSQGRPLTIWHVEAELMLVLTQSGLLNLCKKLVSVDSRTDILAEAFSAKHECLLQQIQNTDGLEKLNYLRELSALFPNDPKSLELLLEIQKKKVSPRRWRMALVFLFLGIGISFWYKVKSERTAAPVTQKQSSESVVTQAMSQVAEAVPETKAEVEIKPAAQKPQVSDRGYLKFVVPDDVDIFVGGQFIPPLRRKNYEVRAGKHLVKMVKEGFLPIENTVIVKPGKQAIVRVGGGG